MRDDVISANKATSEDSDSKRHDDIIATINAHSQIVRQRDAEIAELSKNRKEEEKKYQEAKEALESHKAEIRELKIQIMTVQEEKRLLSKKLLKSEADLGEAKAQLQNNARQLVEQQAIIDARFEESKKSQIMNPPPQSAPSKHSSIANAQIQPPNAEWCSKVASIED